MTLSKSRHDRDFQSFAKTSGGETARRVTMSGQALYNSLDVAVTVIPSGVTTQIDTPENAVSFFIVHKTKDETIYIGGVNTVDETSGFPMINGESLTLENMQKNNENEIYGFCANECTVYCVGVAKI